MFVCFVSPAARGLSLSTLLHASTALAPAVIGVAEGTPWRNNLIVLRLPIRPAAVRT